MRYSNSYCLFHKLSLGIVTRRLLRGILYRITRILIFAGENPLQMSHISAENLTICNLTIAFWQRLCVFTSNNLGFADFIVAN